MSNEDVSELIKVLASQKAKLGRQLADCNTRNAELVKDLMEAVRLLAVYDRSVSHRDIGEKTQAFLSRIRGT